VAYNIYILIYYICVLVYHTYFRVYYTYFRVDYTYFLIKSSRSQMEWETAEKIAGMVQYCEYTEDQVCAPGGFNPWTTLETIQGQTYCFIQSTPIQMLPPGGDICGRLT